MCFSSDDWSDAIWTNRQHVMSRLSRNQVVVFVQTGHFVGKRLVSLLRPRSGEGRTDLIRGCFSGYDEPSARIYGRSPT